ncbi:alpha/beta hydrolase [Rhodococcus sp. NPDC060176]|uniref:alpha/beta hydrolase n=1 Tax=Rhodococcus sp. NPDC060176 TaxID=3347062 RepID=UPI003666CFA8
MATISQVRAWNPAGFATAATELEQKNRYFMRAVESAHRSVDSALDHWKGEASAAASARALADSIAATHLTTGVFAEADALSEAASALEPARAAVIEIADGAIAEGMAVADDGRVSAPRYGSGNTALDILGQAAFDEQARSFEARLIPALHTAGSLDEDAAAALSKAAGDLTDLAQHPGARPTMSAEVAAILDGNAFPPDGARELNEFWESLSPSDKDALAAFDPGIGNRDGMPAADRDHFNRINLGNLQSSTSTELSDLDGEHPDWAQGRNIPSDAGGVDEADQQARRDYERWEQQRVDLQQRLDGYGVLADRIDAALAQEGDSEKYLLGVDGKGRAIVALNNPDTATNVATFVPGTGSHLGTIGGDIDRSQAMLDSGQKALERAGISGSTSVTTWYGYDAPQTIPQAGLDGYADGGAGSLGRFQDGLRASHDGVPSHNTVIGHSYGSTVIGAAASDGRSIDADDLFFVGSPGVGMDRVEGLSLEGISPEHVGGHVYATAAANDPVPMIGDVFGGLSHGANPANDLPLIGFGATVIESAPGTGIDAGLLGELPNPAAHSEYWEINNPALAGMGHVIAGLGAP